MIRLAVYLSLVAFGGTVIASLLCAGVCKISKRPQPKYNA